MSAKRLSTALFVIALASSALAQSVIMNNPGVKAKVAIRNATIVPVTSPMIEHGTIVIADGKIAALGTDVDVPAGYDVVDGTGLYVYPGFIDSGTSIGLIEVSSVAGSDDQSEVGDMNPNASAAVALNPHSQLIPVARVNGITNVIVRPRGGIVSGRDALIQLAGWTPKEMTVKNPVGMHVNFPRKPSGFTTAHLWDDRAREAKKEYEENLEKLRNTLRDARAYAKAMGAHAAGGALPHLDYDPVLEALVPVVRGEEPVVIHADRARDIRAAIDFAEAENLKMILADAEDAAEVAPLLAEKKIPVIFGPVWALPSNEDDPYDKIFAAPNALHDAGVLFAFETADAHNVRNLPYQAANCVAFGLPKEVALEAITINPAKIFGVDSEIGSLEVGKVANLFVADGDPLEIQTNVKHLYIAGEEISLETKHTQLYEKFSKRPKE